MIVAVDVDYEDPLARAALVGFRAWTDDLAAVEHAVVIDEVAAYRPGAFFERELPCILAVLAGLDAAPATVVIDGYVWLAAGRTRPGLGAYLHEALGGEVPVVGVAKNPFAGADAIDVVRGGSARPLYVTAEGVPAADVAAHVVSMHGAHRIPTLLQRVDHLARGRTD